MDNNRLGIPLFSFTKALLCNHTGSGLQAKRTKITEGTPLGITKESLS
jgi:hypothetical protein